MKKKKKSNTPVWLQNGRFSKYHGVASKTEHISGCIVCVFCSILVICTASSTITCQLQKRRAWQCPERAFPLAGKQPMRMQHWPARPPKLSINREARSVNIIGRVPFPVCGVYFSSKSGVLFRGLFFPHRFGVFRFSPIKPLRG